MPVPSIPQQLIPHQTSSPATLDNGFSFDDPGATPNFVPFAANDIPQQENRSLVYVPVIHFFPSTTEFLECTLQRTFTEANIMMDKYMFRLIDPYDHRHLNEAGRTVNATRTTRWIKSSSSGN